VAVSFRRVPLKPTENDLRGQWMVLDGRIVKDEVSKRIDLLVEKYLNKVKADESGWILSFETRPMVAIGSSRIRKAKCTGVALRA
jgi:hypothetical protein